CRRVESQSVSASGKSTSTRLRCRYARRTMAPPVRPPGLRGAPRELRSRATCEIALLSHHHASRVPSSTNNCAFGWVFRAAARTNTGCPRPNSHREVASAPPRLRLLAAPQRKVASVPRCPTQRMHDPNDDQRDLGESGGDLRRAIYEAT